MIFILQQNPDYNDQMSFTEIRPWDMICDLMSLGMPASYTVTLLPLSTDELDWRGHGILLGWWSQITH